MTWKSRRLHRQAASSLLNETLSYSKSVSALLWVMSFDRSPRFTGWKHGGPLFPKLQVPEALTVLSRQARLVVDPPTQGVIDAKSLYDALLSEQTQQDDSRAALEIGVIRDDSALLGMRTRWIPHNLNPADALTKADKAHSDPLIRLLSSGEFQISPEQDELDRRRDAKQELGYAPRLRSNAQKRQNSEN